MRGVGCATLVCLSLVASLPTASAQILSELSLPPNGNNERAEVTQWIGLVKVTIDYHSPNVHGGTGADRTGHIWGELVKYGFFDEGLGPSSDALASRRQRNHYHHCFARREGGRQRSQGWNLRFVSRT